VSLNNEEASANSLLLFLLVHDKVINNLIVYIAHWLSFAASPPHSVFTIIPLISVTSVASSVTYRQGIPPGSGMFDGSFWFKLLSE